VSGVPTSCDAVLLIAFGGPTRPEEIRPFLDNVLRGRPVPQERYEEVVQHYIEVGGSSPLNRLTLLQAEGLERVLREEGPALPVFVGMRHWHPFLGETLASMAARGLRRAVGIVLAPHSSPASREAYFRAATEAQRRVGAAAPAIDFVPSFSDHPLFLESLAGRLGEALRTLPEERRTASSILFTAHSIPVAMSDASGYEASLRRTADAVAPACGRATWRLVFQSRSGHPDEAWLEPDILEALDEEAARGVRDVVVAPIGFVSDHVEVLYDLELAARRHAAGLGLGFTRAGTPGEHPAFLRLLADLVRARLHDAGAEPA
jgi:ferrochelatase